MSLSSARTSTPPVIIIGMHRSGTSLLTRVLQQSGLFMGLGASRNEEAAFTNAVNAWLFRQASATWDQPAAMDELLADETLWPWLVDYMHGITNGPAAARFLGGRRWLRSRGFAGMSTPWGWKDPRNTWTLPLWLALFPEARVLHIVRHGVDVAASLRVRRERAMARNIDRYRRRRAWYVNSPFAPKRRGLGPQPRCRTLAGGFSLWELYVDRARSHLATHAGHSLEVRYEDLLAAPRDELDRALAFCGCHPGREIVEQTAARFDPDRAHAWQHESELVEFAASVSDRLRAHGYPQPDISTDA